MKSVISTSTLLLTLFSLALGDGNPLIGKRQSNSTTRNRFTDLCERRYHSTTVVGDILYINGGEILENRTASFDDFIDYDNIDSIDLSVPWNNSRPELNPETKPSTVVTVKEACAWSDGTNFYQYGGWHNGETQESFRVWEYDGAEWSAVSPGTVNRLASGACVNAPMIRKSYAYGGFEGPRTTNDPWWVENGAGYGRPDLIEFDWETKTARNVSLTDLSSGFTGTLDNGLAYIPVGKQGILVDITGRRSNRADGFSQLYPLTSIRLYDVASSTWYTQATTLADSAGDPPNARVQACLVVQPAADNSSFNIYMYGGSLNNAPDRAYNNMWILSLPSFKWIRVYNVASDSDSDIPKARTSHTCQLAGKRQMLVIGGARNPAAHTQCNTRSVSVFDMSALRWKAGYDPSEPAYELHENITNVIGGDSFGNADPSRNRPANGWANLAVQSIFFNDDTVSNSTATSTPDVSPPSSSGAIVGGVVGGLAAVAAIVGGLLLLRRRRRRQSDQKVVGGHDRDQNMAELGNEPALHELDPASPAVYELGGQGDYYGGHNTGASSAVNELDAEPHSPRVERNGERALCEYRKQITHLEEAPAV